MTGTEKLGHHNQEKVMKHYRELIEFSINNNGRFPSFREFAKIGGLDSSSLADYWLRILQRLGYLGWRTSNGRGYYYIIGATWTPPDWYKEKK